MTVALYARAAPIYRGAGWTYALPLPEHAKHPPPTGYTGATGLEPDDAQIAAWCVEHPDGNICLRLPKGVMGIDIDAYGDKTGGQSLAELEAKWGVLPPTWRSTSRSDGVSGIRLYQVPFGRYIDKPAPNIEIIQHHHRYMVAPPSIHPSGEAYFWLDATDARVRTPPTLSGVTKLAAPWIEGLKYEERPTGLYVPRGHAVDEWTPAVTRAFTKALMDMPGGRHDATLHGALALVRLESLEHPGASAAIAELRHRFVAAIADRATDSQAIKEWCNIIDGAYARVDTEPATSPKWEQRHTYSNADVDAMVDGAQPPPDPDQPLIGGLVDWQAFWAGAHIEQDWLIEPLLARGRAHALYAPAKAGKSLLALEIAAAAATGRPVLNQAAQAPMTVLYLDFEMTESDLHERLTDLGYSETDDLSRFHYHLLPSLAALDTTTGGALVVAEAQRVGAELVVIDTVARVIEGEESSSDTFIALARYTMTPLKRLGITVLRIDHAGKNLEKGQRNSSAKNDDVDIVWQLTIADQGAVTLKATHRRLSWVPEIVNLTRTADPLTHKATPIVWPAGTAEAARKLDEAGAAYDISTRAAQELIGGKRTVIVAACRYRRTWEPPAGTTSDKGVGTTPRNHPDDTPSEQGEPVREPPGTTIAGYGEPESVSIETLRSQPQPPTPHQPDLSAWDTEDF